MVCPPDVFNNIIPKSGHTDADFENIKHEIREINKKSA
jgi:hypothetical protein